MIPVSRLASSIQPSATIAAGAKARELKSAGIQVYDFSLGEPDFTTPEHICHAATAAMAQGHTHYTAVAGIPELRSAICAWYKSYHQFDCTPDMVVVSNGAKHSIHNALQSICNPGDEVIIPTPYWVSYADLVLMTGATPVFVPATAENRFLITPEQLRSAITPKSKLIMLNSPSNPTGSVYSREELAALMDVILETDIVVLSDEIYEQLTFDGVAPTCIAGLKPELKERTITISGASKSYAMTGWRMGWSVAPKGITNAMTNVQSQQTSCPSSVSQYALLAAMTGSQDCVAEMRKAFDERRHLATDLLGKIPGLKFPIPTGAFYVFFDIRSYYGKTFGNISISDSASFCKAALEQAHVNLVQGSAFGAEGYVRMSYATANRTIVEGIGKLAEWLATGV